jgi:NAD-dependent dihydropyrimidine dehydrogenase PreA subunit
MYFIEVDIDKCEASGECVDTCPNESFIIVETDGKEHAEFLPENDCTGCESCVAICPTEALTLIEM